MSAYKASFRLTRFLSRTPCRRRFATAPSDKIRIIEVGPRDGLQNEKSTVPVETKIELIERLAKTGLRTIEAGSFVSPKWTPQMANSSEILDHILNNPPSSDPSIVYQFLVPNTKGLDNFFSVYNQHHSSAAGTPPMSPNGEATTNSPNSAALPQIEVALFTAATEAFTQKNTNCSIAESLERFKPIFSQAKDANIPVRAYISVALGCPYEGPDVDPHKVAELAVTLLEMGAYEISVADTTGLGTAPKTRRLLQTLAAAGVDKQDLALHFHDTYGQALVNTVIGLEHGVRTFDSAVAGLGGCPYSPGATGNVSSEDLIWLCEALAPGSTGVNTERLAAVGEWISKEVGRKNESRSGKAILAKLKRAS